MGAIDDTRKLLQDLITPDLKALEARLVALEQKMDLKFKQADEKFAGLEQKIDLRFKQVDEKFAGLEQKMDLRFKHMEEKMELKFDIVAATMAANQSAIMRALDMERRIERLESDKENGKNLDRPA